MSKTGPQHGIVGDDSVTELPETTIDENQLVDEQKAAKFSKTAEFKKLKEHLEDRIEFYQKYLPDGRAVVEEPAAELGNKWMIANAIIGEFTAVIAAYEEAAKVVQEHARRTNT